MLRFTTLTIFLALAAACGDNGLTLPRNDGGDYILLDAQAEPPSRPFFQDTPPSETPYPVVTLRADVAVGERLIVRGAGNPYVVPRGSDGFCVDVPLPAEGEYSLEVRSQNIAGQLSEPQFVSVRRSSAASPPAGARLCDGSDPAGCMGTVEICGNGTDDDCNGLRDNLDPACVTCDDDLYEPNDDLSAPQVMLGRIDDLMLCEGDSDYFAVRLGAGETLQARLRFVHSAGNLDMEVLSEGGTPLANASSESDDESIDYTNSGPGAVVVQVRVYGVGGVSNTYVLELDRIEA